MLQKPGKQLKITGELPKSTKTHINNNLLPFGLFQDLFISCVRFQ